MNTRPSEPDTDDAPELDQEWFEHAHRYHGDTLVKRGRGRPPLEPKECKGSSRTTTTKT